jgi:hypothetical protein
MSRSDHSCAFFDGIEDARRTFGEAVAEAERINFKCLVVIDQAKHTEYQLDGVKKPALSNVAFAELGMEETPVSIANVIRRIRWQTEATVSSGFSGLLLLSTCHGSAPLRASLITANSKSRPGLVASSCHCVSYASITSRNFLSNGLGCNVRKVPHQGRESIILISCLRTFLSDAAAS